MEIQPNRLDVIKIATNTHSNQSLKFNGDRTINGNNHGLGDIPLTDDMSINTKA